VKVKDWYTIGEFAKRIGVSTKALRLYEQMGLLRSHTRGENRYRYYLKSQIDLANRLKEFKTLGFSLAEIKSLLTIDQDLGSEKIADAMRNRLNLIAEQIDQLHLQRQQIETILASLTKKSEPLKAPQRRAIMNLYGKVSIVVTGQEGLEKTASYIQRHFQKANQDVSIIRWTSSFSQPENKPYILIIEEKVLSAEPIRQLHPDVIVVRNLGEHSERSRQSYLNLYTGVGPHVNTVINADDRSAVELASQAPLKKGRIFYYSKNKGLEPQIKRIGGVVSDGEDVEIYGLNLKPEPVSLRLPNVKTFDDEVALISSLGALLTLGFSKEQFAIES
jgi:DNA-binding transcriptional MerR regulator